uniref:Uncharacterized protein n=1 Tax=Anguilla anguilla TaxID=7936 RepID=A0A0E9WCE5_ANGAN
MFTVLQAVCYSNDDDQHLSKCTTDKQLFK